MKRIVPVLFCSLMVMVSSLLAQDGRGGYAAAYLQVPIGARPAAMGGAYTAISNDGAGALYNPAGMVSLDRPLFASSYRAMQLDRKLGYVGLFFPVRGQSVLGVHWLFSGSGGVEARDFDGYPLGHEISHNAHNISILFAKQFERWVSLGVNMTYQLESITELSTNSVGFDFGLMFQIQQMVSRERRDDFPIKDLQVGITLKNIARRLSWNSENYDLIHSTDRVGSVQDDEVPVELGFGISGRFLERRLLLASDLIKSDKQEAAIHAGVEYALNHQFALRSGYSDGRLTAGTGYLFRVGGSMQLAIDYAFSTDKADEGSEHIFSFDLLF